METPEKVVMGLGTDQEYAALVSDGAEVRWYACGKVTVTEYDADGHLTEKTVHMFGED